MYTNSVCLDDQNLGERCVKFEWDEQKRYECFVKHRVDMLFAASIFDGETAIWQDLRFDYDETRFCAVGMIEGDCYVVVYTWRGENMRLISARKGGRRDRRRYQDRHTGGNNRDAGEG